MAEVQISVKDREEAMSWLQKVMETNELYHTAMEEAGHALTEINEFSEGTLVDDIVNFGTDLMNAGQQIFEGISTIADTVTSLVNSVSDFIDNAKGAIKNALGKIF